MSLFTLPRRFGKTLIDLSGPTEKEEIETLIAGGTLTKPVYEDVTYGDMNSSMDNLRMV